MSARGQEALTRLGKLAGRAASIVAGVLVLRHEVYQTEEAELLLVALGLWLIGIPPALWLDTVRRAQEGISKGASPDRRTGGSDSSGGGDEA